MSFREWVGADRAGWISRRVMFKSGERAVNMRQRNMRIYVSPQKLGVFLASERLVALHLRMALRLFHCLLPRYPQTGWAV